MSISGMKTQNYRTTPKQTRSQERINLILDTAAALFAETGYEAATTNAIAERAGISIGSLYRYFPDKETILSTMMDRYQRDMLSIFEQGFNEDIRGLPLPSLMDRLIDPFLEKHLAQPVYNQILLGAEASPAIARAVRELDEESSRRIAGLVALLFPQLDEQRAQLTTKVVKAISKSMFNLITAATDEESRQRLTEEYKHLLLAYAESLRGL